MNMKLIEMAGGAKYKPNFIVVIILSLVFVILGSTFGFVSYLFDLEGAYQMAISDLMMAFGSITCIVFLYVKIVEKRPISSIGFEKEHALKKYIKGFVIGLLMFTLAIVIGVLTGAYEIKLSLSTVKFDVLLIILLGFIIQGGTEEVVFRGWVLPILGVRYNVTFAIILSSIMFCALHAFNPGMTILPVINLLMFGLFAAVFALNEKGIWGICGMHTAWNWVQGSVYGVKVSGTDVPGGSILMTTPTEGMDFLSGGAFGLEGSIICTLVFLIPAVYLILKMRKEATC